MPHLSNFIYKLSVKQVMFIQKATSIFTEELFFIRKMCVRVIYYQVKRFVDNLMLFVSYKSQVK